MLSYCLKCRTDAESKYPKVVKTKNGRLMVLNLSKIPLVGLILLQRHKMNEIINKFLLAGDKFMPEMHLRQPRFTYSACGPVIKSK